MLPRIKFQNLNKDPSHRLPLEDIEKFFINGKANGSLPNMIRMDDIRKFTNDSLQMDYFTWYLEQCSTLDAEIFNNPELRAEPKPFSKSLHIYDYYQQNEISHLKDRYVPAFLNFQQNMTKGFFEETDRCYLYPIADNIVAVLLRYLVNKKFLKDAESGNILRKPLITAHIRRVIQFFIIPSQLYDRKPCDIEITMQKV